MGCRQSYQRTFLKNDNNALPIKYKRKNNDDKGRSRLGNELCSVVSIGDTEEVRRLVENGHEPNSRTKFGFSALHIAAEKSHDAILRMLLDFGGDPNIRCGDQDGGLTPLMVAASVHSCTSVATLLEFGADVNMADDWGNTPLLKVCYSGCTECLCKLLSSNAEPNMCNKWNASALQHAARLQNISMMKLLIDNGSDVSHPGDTSSYPPFFYMAKWNNIEGMRMLMDAGADIEAESKGKSLFSFLTDTLTVNYNGVDDYPHALAELINRGIDVAKESQSYIRQKCEYNIYINNDYFFSIFKMVLICQGFEHNSTVLKRLFTNYIKGNGQETKVLPFMLSIGLTPDKGLIDDYTDANGQKLEVLNHFHRHPRTLRDICRLRIRLIIASNVPYNSKQFEIPKMLQEYISLSSEQYYSTAD